MKEYAIEQRRFNEKVFGRGTRSIDSVEGLLNKYAQEQGRLDASHHDDSAYQRCKNAVNNHGL